MIHIESPSELPDMSHVDEIRKPIVRAAIIIPAELVGVLMTLALDRKVDHAVSRGLP